jgi:pimeloyl-ACP methyl ester carboxylesterase
MASQVAQPAIDWDDGEKASMVSIGSHKLHLSAAGPNRKPGEPVIVLMQGLGSTIDEWVAVRRLVLPFARWLNYDRSGLGRSENPPEAPEAISAVSVATELDILLRNAGVSPPYIVVCHSWGGITSREFLNLRPKDIVGMVFVDANTENTYDGGKWPLPYINAVIGDQNWIETTGLAAAHKLSNDEWAAWEKEQNDPRHQITEAAESRGYQGDSPILAAKKQFERQPLGDHPISVIRANTPRDFQLMYDAGVAAGNGTEEERALYREYLSKWDEKDHRWQEEILRLSTFGRLVRAAHSGHNVQMVDPPLVAKEIKWVWDHVV